MESSRVNVFHKYNNYVPPQCTRYCTPIDAHYTSKG